MPQSKATFGYVIRQPAVQGRQTPLPQPGQYPLPNILEKRSSVSLTANNCESRSYSVARRVRVPGDLFSNKFSLIIAAVFSASVMLPLLCDSTGAEEVGKKSLTEKAETAGTVEKPKTTTFSLRGRVVWMAEALERRFGIQTVPEAAERMLALEIPGGELHPIIEDLRGRSFRKDERFRGVDVELLVRRYEGSPMIRVIRIYALKKDGKFELDYWCDICAIGMYESGPCDCCQELNRLRERRVEGP